MKVAFAVSLEVCQMAKGPLESLGIQPTEHLRLEMKEEPQRTAAALFAAEVLAQMNSGGALGLNGIMGQSLTGWHRDSNGNWQVNRGGGGTDGLGGLFGGAIMAVFGGAERANPVLDLSTENLYPKKKQK